MPVCQDDEDLCLSVFMEALLVTGTGHFLPPGLTLSAIAVAAVFDDVTITVKWLLDLPRGNLSCKLSTGDGHVIYLHSPEG